MTIPALIAAFGTIATAYVSVKVRAIAVQTDGRMTHLENELKLVRQLLAASELARHSEANAAALDEQFKPFGRSSPPVQG